MLRSLRAPLLRSRPSALPRAFYRPLAVASSETFKNPSSSIPPQSNFLDAEPKKPSIITEIPGPKVKAAKEAMGKIQDVTSYLSQN
jgi:hypothetical protein